MYSAIYFWSFFWVILSSLGWLLKLPIEVPAAGPALLNELPMSMGLKLNSLL